MPIKIKSSKRKTVTKRLTKQQKIDKLLKEINESRKEYKKGNYIKGDAETIIKHLRNAASQKQ